MPPTVKWGAFLFFPVILPSFRGPPDGGLPAACMGFSVATGGGLALRNKKGCPKMDILFVEVPSRVELLYTVLQTVT